LPGPFSSCHAPTWRIALRSVYLLAKDHCRNRKPFAPARGRRWRRSRRMRGRGPGRSEGRDNELYSACRPLSRRPRKFFELLNLAPPQPVLFSSRSLGSRSSSSPSRLCASPAVSAAARPRTQQRARARRNASRLAMAVGRSGRADPCALRTRRLRSVQ
jgi:hypothetical protein